VRIGLLGDPLSFLDVKGIEPFEIMLKGINHLVFQFH